MKENHSEQLFKEASKHIPGGVNSPVRAFKSVGSKRAPLFIKKAKGAFIWDSEGQQYIDLVGSWGAAILGHAHPEVIETLAKTIQDGLSFGAPTEKETQLAALLCETLPSLEQVRLVSSGTEACMSALRVARAYTKRDKIIKFSGNYHGHADCLLAQAGSGIASQGLPDSQGVPAEFVQNTLTAPYNDTDAVCQLFEEHPQQIAAIIVEPFVGNSGFIRPKKNFLESLRTLCDQNNSLLIFDEVMTGFRVAWGGAQTLLNITPDLSTFGKVIGGGLPLAAFGGKYDIMQQLAPVGSVYQAGTLSGNPIAVSCGLKTLEILARDKSYSTLSSSMHKLTTGLSNTAKKFEISLQADGQGAMFGCFFGTQCVENFEHAKKTETLSFQQFFYNMLEQKIYWPPSAYEAAFLSLSHSSTIIDKILEASSIAFERLSR